MKAFYVFLAVCIAVTVFAIKFDIETMKKCKQAGGVKFHSLCLKTGTDIINLDN